MDSLQISPDLKQNIFYTVYFIFLHNLPAIFYFTGILVSIVLLIIKPARWNVFLMLGFILLLFGFEYTKHISQPLQEQTLNSLITVRQHFKVYRIVNLLLSKALPILLPITGWILIITGIILSRTSSKKRHK